MEDQVQYVEDDGKSAFSAIAVAGQAKPEALAEDVGVVSGVASGRGGMTERAPSARVQLQGKVFSMIFWVSFFAF